MRRLLSPAAALLLASCALGPAARLAVLLPPLPAAWRQAFPRVDCLLVYRDCTGEIRREKAGGWVTGHVIDCSKEGNAPVLAYPVLPSDAADPPQPGALRPAGGIFPWAARQDEAGPAIQLTWKDGAAATVALDLGAAGLDASHFNVARLAEELEEYPDPWDIDLDGLVQRIVSGDFDVYDIDPLPARDIRLPAGEGLWVTESPFRGAVEGDAEGVLRLSGVSQGMHVFFSSTGVIVKVDVRGSQVISVPILPSAGVGGTRRLAAQERRRPSGAACPAPPRRR